ncbi:MAG: CHAT domain-containing protein [Saprospiraceae bacterium]|nr:CHAT domain-containing protein [Saprospiraceae bacterium]
MSILMLFCPKEKSKHERLSLNQISALTMDAQQVVLSSCKSSAGILDNTEGILSLSRGFLLAGASSVISSLWSVNDKSTALIMENYYKYIW